MLLIIQICQIKKSHVITNPNLIPSTLHIVNPLPWKSDQQELLPKCLLRPNSMPKTCPSLMHGSVSCSALWGHRIVTCWTKRFSSVFLPSCSQSTWRRGIKRHDLLHHHIPRYLSHFPEAWYDINNKRAIRRDRGGRKTQLLLCSISVSLHGQSSGGSARLCDWETRDGSCSQWECECTHSSQGLIWWSSAWW